MQIMPYCLCGRGWEEGCRIDCSQTNPMKQAGQNHIYLCVLTCREAMILKRKLIVKLRSVLWDLSPPDFQESELLEKRYIHKL